MTAAFTTAEAIKYGVSRFTEETRYCVLILGSVEIGCLVSSAVLANQLVMTAQLLTGLDSMPPDAALYPFVPIYLIARTAAQILVNKALLLLHDGRKMTRDEFLGFDWGVHLPQAMRMLASSLVYSLCGILLTALLIVPGLLACSNLRLFKFVLIDHETPAIEGLRESFDISGTSKGELVSLNVLSTAMRAIGLLCLGVGFIPVSAICGLAEAYAYKRLTQAYEFQQQRAIQPQ